VRTRSSPRPSRERGAIYAVARGTVAFVWIYHGLVPKLLLRHPGELAMLRQSGLFRGREALVLPVIGAGEILFGLLLLACWRMRALLLVQVLLLLGLTAGALAAAPATFVAPFNPLTLNLSLGALGLIGFWSGGEGGREGE
jgi:hypothetical protein